MNKLGPTHPTPDIARLQEASDWVQRLHESQDVRLIEGWADWYNADPLNPSAFERIQSLWDGFATADEAAAAHNETAAAPRKPRHGLAALAAGMAVLIAGAAWVGLHRSDSAAFDTPVGRQRRITLPDGSQLDLAPDSRVRTRFTPGSRDVELERGQAFFQVVHETLRPFVVHVDGLNVTAVGTSFDVRIDPRNTVVTVGEGRVDVAGTAAGAGQRVTFAAPSRRLSVSVVGPNAAGAWRNGILQFVAEPLEDVVGEINRYSARKISVAPPFQETRFTGTVLPANVGDWLAALEQIYPLTVVYQSNDRIRIRSLDDHAQPTL